MRLTGGGIDWVLLLFFFFCILVWFAVQLSIGIPALFFLFPSSLRYNMGKLYTIGMYGSTPVVRIFGTLGSIIAWVEGRKIGYMWPSF